MALNGLRLDLDRRADGVRIYARLACETIGALDAREVADGTSKKLAVTVLYVLPRWRDRGIATALLERFNEYALSAASILAPQAGS